MACTAEEEAYLKQKAEDGFRVSTSPIQKLRYACLMRGANGIKGLGRSFRIMDDDGSKTLDFREFRDGLYDFGLRELDDQTIAEIFQELDKDGSGKLSYDEFLVAIRGPINKTRQEYVVKAFKKLDATRDGQITVEDIRRLYDASQHPKFQSGEWTEDQCFRRFLDSFDTPGNPDGVVTKDEFMNYYSGVSASIDDDGYFCTMMKRAWRM
ncbi:calcyphosin-like protein [Ostrea edulis]|uniref:calcyphosin-like protein n=1 Tax=Ostrea edulis TaxID=37623 RepID=UPI0020951D0F|nr:calcyphosin-like protein [Ostrea edulis]